jgi:hypothetical protein
LEVIARTGNTVTGERLWLDNARLSYDTGTTSALDSTNLALYPNLETDGTGWYSNDSTKYVLTRDTVAPIGGLASAMTTRSTNLVTNGANGTFEGGVITGWGANGNTQAADATVKRSGSHSLKATYTVAANGQGPSAFVSGLVVGASYTVEGWIYLPAASAGSLPCVRMSAVGSPSANQPVSTYDTWVYSSQTWVATATQHTIFCSTQGPTTDGMVAYFDDIKVYSTPDTTSGSIYNAASSTARIPVTPGATYTASVDVKAELANRKGRLYFLWYPAATGSSTGSSGSPVVYQALTDVTTTRINHTATVPAGMNFCIPVIVVYVNTGTATVGERCWYDNMRISQDPTATAAVTDTNLVQNPGVETNTLGWYSNDASKYPISSDATAPISGVASVMATRAAGTLNNFAASMYLTGGLSAAITAIPVVPGVPITWSLDVKAELAGRQSRIGVWFRDEAGVAVGGGVYPPSYTTLTAGVVSRMLTTATPPAGAAFAYIGVDVSTVSAGNATVGERVWFDRCYAGADPVGAYYDGTYAIAGDVWYQWTGTANASTTQKMLTSNRTAAAQLTGYFDGDTMPTADYWHRWTGTVNASTSERMLISGRAVDSDYFDGDSPDAGNFRYDWAGTAKASASRRWTQAPTPEAAPTGQATGGTQSQGGNGGTSSMGAQFNGANASDTICAIGGAGGSASVSCHGGGGGGGGYHSGGGGQASAVGYAPGGGGGGGSNFFGGLTGQTSRQGAGGVGNGSVSITWIAPAPANQPPTTPSGLKINGVDESPGMLTKATKSVKVTANISDPAKQKVRLLVRWSVNSSFTTYSQVFSDWLAYDTKKKKYPNPASVTLTGLSQNTHYYLRAYSQDSAGKYSADYNGADFWTNKAPVPPTGLGINTQGSGMTLPSLSSATFDWTHNDPDLADYQSAFQLQYRKAATSVAVAGAWTVVTQYVGQNLAPVVPGPPSASHNNWVFDPGTFKGNTIYEWQVRTRDKQSLWGAWSLLFTFRSTSTTSPPVLLTPRTASAVDVHEPTTFTWRFVDPDTGDQQRRADIRYRAIADPQPDWIQLLGSVAPGVPGGDKTWTLPSDTFVAGYRYEWQMRTYDASGGPPSAWSDSSSFYAIDTPGSQSAPLPVGDAVKPQGSLGCGEYRVFVYEQGGQKRLGELDPMTRMTFTRVRDDISSCTVFSSGYSVDCGALYASMRCWMHELVVFRDGVRVWEGPITRIGYSVNEVEFEAKDVMAYVYRRVLRAGYNDAYKFLKAGTGGEPDQYLGMLSVVKRAASLITQALAPYDPNVLPYLTTIEYPDDARESRVVADWSRSAWEEVDDLAATAGLDYATVGRRILLWDTHRAVGRLPELRDGDFSDSPIVTEYGMQLATFFAVTNGSGVVGSTEVAAGHYPFGPIEHLASSYSDSAAATAEIQTPAALAKAQESMVEQAKRNISGRWPAPLIVRIPDNSTLSPKANIGFQQLIPGVWVPLRSVNTPRQVTQWQKLDSIGVEVDDKGEKVHVVLSPAPNGGNDPDSDVAAEEG